jgi:hypothetical protein
LKIFVWGKVERFKVERFKVLGSRLKAWSGLQITFNPLI